MKLNAILLSCAGLLLLHVPLASAEDFDPALSSNGAELHGYDLVLVPSTSTLPILFFPAK